MEKPFWEETYKNKEIKTFGNPSPEIIDLVDLMPQGSLILDAGCGEGRNAIYLAQQDFKVEAFDISVPGIARVKELAAESKVRLEARVDDITRFEFKTEYDVVIVHGVLHLLERPVWSRFIQDMKKHTRLGGINIVVVFTDEIPPPADLAPFVKGLFTEGELAVLYSDWHIKLFKSYIFEDEHSQDIRHTHPINKIVAVKG